MIINIYESHVTQLSFTQNYICKANPNIMVWHYVVIYDGLGFTDIITHYIFLCSQKIIIVLSFLHVI